MLFKSKIVFAFTTLTLLVSNCVYAQSSAITVGSSCVGIRDDKDPKKTNIYTIKNINENDFSMSSIVKYGFHVRYYPKHLEDFRERYAGNFLFSLDNLKYFTEDMLTIDDQCQKNESCRKTCLDVKRFNCYSSCKELVGNKGVRARVINKSILEHDVQNTYSAADFEMNIHKTDPEEIFCASENDKRTKIVVKKTCEQLENEFKMAKGNSKGNSKSKSTSSKASSN